MEGAQYLLCVSDSRLRDSPRFLFVLGGFPQSSSAWNKKMLASFFAPARFFGCHACAYSYYMLLYLSDGPIPGHDSTPGNLESLLVGDISGFRSFPRCETLFQGRSFPRSRPKIYRIPRYFPKVYPVLHERDSSSTTRPVIFYVCLSPA